MTNATEQNNTVVNLSPLHLSIMMPDGRKDFIYLKDEEIKTFNKKKTGWYHLLVPAAVEGEPTPIPTIQNRLSDNECAKYEISHTDPTVGIKGDAEVKDDVLPTDEVDTKPEVDAPGPTPEEEESLKTPGGFINVTNETDIEDAAKEIHNAAMNEEHPLCAESARKGLHQFATHLMTLKETDADGKHLTEYRHISTIGPKNTYKAIRSI